jgi:hypothetical protein
MSLLSYDKASLEVQASKTVRLVLFVWHAPAKLPPWKELKDLP